MVPVHFICDICWDQRLPNCYSISVNYWLIQSYEAKTCIGLLANQNRLLTRFIFCSLFVVRLTKLPFLSDHNVMKLEGQDFGLLLYNAYTQQVQYCDL